MLTNGQKKALHSAARQLGLLEPERRLVQRNIGGFFSAADRTASRQGFIAVMAFFEAKAGGQIGGSDRGYWQDQDAHANPLDALRHRVNQAAKRMGWSSEDVDKFLASEHMSSGLFATAAEAPAYWLSRLLDGMQAIERRTRR